MAEFINFDVFVEVIEVCSQARILPTNINKSGRVFIVIDNGELNIIRFGVNHIRLLPITIALKDKVITAVLI